jgi:hypothetical protein
MKMLFRCSAVQILFGIVIFQLAGAAVAQQPSQAQANAIRQSCRSDYQSYCSSVPTGGAASLQCLQSHLSQLSSPCQTAVSSASGGGSAPPAAAGSGQATPGTASAQPGAPPMSPRAKMAAMRQACGGDFRVYCRGVPLGGGAAMRCLAENQSRLSPGCRDAMVEAHGTR